MFCKGLISKIYKEFIQLNSKQKKIHLKKGKVSIDIFFQRRNTDGKQAQRMMLYICNLQRNDKSTPTEFTPSHLPKHQSSEEHK